MTTQLFLLHQQLKKIGSSYEVTGRAASHIKIGDQLVLHVEGKLIPFKLLAIEEYRKQVHELHTMHAGLITIECLDDFNSDLKMDDVLCKE